MSKQAHWNDSKIAIMGDKATELSHAELTELLSLPSGTRPRIYGYLATGESAGQTVALRSLYHVDKYGNDLAGYWLSGTTINDLVTKA